MRIKRLDITGFKSFMERSVFTFDDGVTGIVGPNGCGKSNVVDAIRWAMGEQSAKNLRGRGMEDVIFNGSESKPPLSMSEVSLTFKIEDGDQLAPQYAGFPEVTVTRRLFRSGESEYLINKSICRLLDITELFLGTGVGTRAYSIIEQGRVGLIVSAKPEDRRSFIEEAAGVTKYKARRKAAERKMEYTQQNLLRVTDIVSELKGRLDALQRQAKKAEKYKKLKAEMREIDLHSASHKYFELLAEKKVLAVRLENLGTEEKAGLEQVRELEEIINQRRTALDEETVALQTLAEQVHSLESQVKLDEQNLTHWTSDREQTQERITSAENELTELATRNAEVAEGIAARERELDSLSGSWKDDDVAMQAAQDELRRALHTQSELTVRLETERSALVQIATRLANHESNLANLAARKADFASRQGRVRTETEGVRAEVSKQDTARAEVAKRVGESRQLAIELEARKGAEEELLNRTRQAFAENEIHVISLREELSDKRSRVNSLQEIQRTYEGFDRGVRAVMLKAGDDARQMGIFGLVADVISTTPRYEKALEAALGARLQHVVVESRAKGFELVDYLKSASEGRSSFIAADVVADRGVAEPDLSRPGVLSTALAEVRCEDALQPVLRSLLGDVVIVEDLQVAREYAQSAGRAFTLVTLEGEVVTADGTVTGGTLEGAAVGALQKKREIAELSEEVGRVEVRYNETLTRHYGLQKQIEHTEGILKGLAKNQHAEELNIATQEKDLHKTGEDLARLRDRLGTLEQEDGQLQAQLAGLESDEEASRGEVAHGQTDRDLRGERVRQLGAELEALKVRADMLNAELTSLRVKVAANTERGGAARKDLEQLLAQRDENALRAHRTEELLATSTAHLITLNSQVDTVSATREAKSAQVEELGAQLETRRTAHTTESTALRDQEVTLREVRTRLDELIQGLSELSLKERELAMAMVHLEEQVLERHQTPLHLELHTYHLLPPLPPEAEQKLKELRAQVERMGEINLTAIEEYQELSNRHDFLANQKKDLEESLAQLQSAIQKIDETSRERFKQTFDVVNEKFQQIFPRLFGGGRASLILTNEGPGAEPGVEIVAQPPGKKLQSVQLFSGGEKALTAVGLIFAIFLIKPTPVCLLDEVDAPLDEANVGRYNDMVKEMSKQSQFIVITHNKRTMEAADYLYGITMEEPGISSVVSVALGTEEREADVVEPWA
ncbi:MAG: chromosome segregation protein SMC, partial [Myxococcaceae bacterium]